MDINELEGLMANVMSDGTSTEDCRRRFEGQLATIENNGEAWLERRFMRLKNFFRNCLMRIIEEGEAGEGEYADKLHRLQHLINQVSKIQAFGLIERTRNQLRKTIPELRQTDNYKNLFRKKLGGGVDEPTLERMVRAGISDDKDRVISLGETLSNEQQIQYYDAMGMLNHRRAVYACRLFQAARRGGKTGLYPVALKKMGTATVFTQEDMVAYSHLARKLEDKVHMQNALKKLERYLDFTSELISYAHTAKKLGDGEAMLRAMGKLSRNLQHPAYLNTFASLARALNHEGHKQTAMEKLETKLDSPVCLTNYAAIARDRNDTDKMQKVLPLLAEQRCDVACLTMFGAIARRLNDPEATLKSLELLEPFVRIDLYCLTTYAKNAIALNDQKRKSRAMIELKHHLHDPICELLYLKIAESSDRQTMMETPAAE